MKGHLYLHRVTKLTVRRSSPSTARTCSGSNKVTRSHFDADRQKRVKSEEHEKPSWHML